MGTIEGMESVADRLKRLKSQEQDPKPKPVTNPFFDNKTNKQKEQPKVTRETIFMNKLDRAILNIEAVEKKMKESDMFLNYYDELKATKKKFFELLKEAEERNVIFPERYHNAIDKARKKYGI